MSSETAIPAHVDVGELDNERRFLLRSLSDLESERAAGDIPDDDYLALKARYTAKAAEIIRLLDQVAKEARDLSTVAAEAAGIDTVGVGPEADSSSGPGERSDTAVRAEQIPRYPKLRGSRGIRRGRSWQRKPWLLICGALAVVSGVLVLVLTANTGLRLPGASATGSVTLSRQQAESRLLAQASSLDSQGQVGTALRLFTEVLSEDPNQPEALSEAGRLEFAAGIGAKNAGLAAKGEQLEQTAVAVQPGWWAPRLYLGSMYLTENDPSAAVTQYEQFLNDNPPIDQVKAAGPYMAKAFTAEGLKVPNNG